MSKVVPFAQAREALLARLTEQLPPSTEWAGRLMLMPEGNRVEPMPAAEAVEVLRAFRAGLGEAIGAAPCSVGGMWVSREDCLDWDGLLAPLAVAAGYVVAGATGGAGLSVELFRCKGALAGWGVRGLRGEAAVARSAGYAVVMVSRRPDDQEIVLDRVMDTFGFVMRSQGEPVVETGDLNARLARRACPLRR
ncbi:hypothetical protein D9623_17295 [Azospirillum brasilense]|uniref:Uncharacterized protein n=1 Tax=Azospirillum brasilense TaxID=192 RepID=A0A0P0EW81_AZOBR|nr:MULTISPECIES: hypothetical protein [Azospirillum]ALJ36719.1 hypothetical protein AMK58_14410 [Azospirillum brasilense]MDW7555949.1 hypothetical protein [Azospirillum brasilense]MDW7595321.1 hypothetical protein [Azospirillum brasilense]MDW7630202.1 hypothetical protein [Azospirillum brasilense]MDX5951677.1 hypothetical protein [Azospirillum brasilense]